MPEPPKKDTKPAPVPKTVPQKPPPLIGATRLPYVASCCCDSSLYACDS